jgi:hypothetical protein
MTSSRLINGLVARHPKDLRDEQLPRHVAENGQGRLRVAVLHQRARLVDAASPEGEKLMLVHGLAHTTLRVGGLLTYTDRNRGMYIAPTRKDTNG